MKLKSVFDPIFSNEEIINNSKFNQELENMLPPVDSLSVDPKVVELSHVLKDMV